MNFRVFQYPIPGVADLADLNAYLAGHRVLEVRQHLVSTQSGATLVFVVQSVSAGAAARPEFGGGDRGRKIDYRAELSPEDFAVYSRLREERKKLAEAEGVPAYMVFTNEQLASLARSRPETLSAMGGIEGIGKARIEKHGERLLSLIHPPTAEAGPAGDPNPAAPPAAT
ncbi:MAG: HRDC domain-containing protein [Verrucomicrobiales bacterium]|nr:HRDC domain-containing protein [Verrucomicrobiales bacterium]